MGYGEGRTYVQNNVKVNTSPEPPSFRPSSLRHSTPPSSVTPPSSSVIPAQAGSQERLWIRNHHTKGHPTVLFKHHMVLYIRILPVVREVFLDSGLRRKDGRRELERRVEKCCSYHPLPITYYLLPIVITRSLPSLTITSFATIQNSMIKPRPEKGWR